MQVRALPGEPQQNQHEGSRDDELRGPSCFHRGDCSPGTHPHAPRTITSLCFFSNVNAYNLLPLYLQKLGGREGEIGTIMAMFSVAGILYQATLGGLLDRWRRRPVLLVATGILTVVSAAFVGTSHLGWQVYGLRFLQGAVLAIFTTSNLTLVGEIAPPNC